MTQRFIISPISLEVLRDLAEDIHPIDLIKNKSILIISQPSYYILNEQEIIKWCDLSLTNWSQKGMILGFVNDEERNLFLMRWA
jgi:hypothetical protein